MSQLSLDPPRRQTRARLEPVTGLPPRASGAAALEVLTDAGALQVVALGATRVTLGRSPHSDLVLEDHLVSRHHATIRFEEGEFVIEDEGSSNGVLVGGQRVQRAVLREGDELTLGNTRIRFVRETPEVNTEERVQVLRMCPLLEGLAPEAMRQLAAQAELRSFPSGASIRGQSDPVDQLWFVVGGEVEVVEINEEGGRRTLGHLFPGDYWGELSLLPGQPGNAALVAKGQAALLEVRRERWEELLRSDPAAKRTVQSSLRAVLRGSQVVPVEELVAPGGGAGEVAGESPIAEVEILGEDRKIVAARERVAKLAADGSSVLLVGPPGSGKRTFARYYHQVGLEAGEPYYELSLSGLESPGAALFGVEADPGVPHMTGALGYLETLGTGTLVLTHAEGLDAHQQHRLATYLRLGWFHRDYGQAPVRSQTRIVLVMEGSEAEISDRMIPELRAELEKGRVVLPSLEQRLKDVPLLASHFLELHASRIGKRVGALSREAIDRLLDYRWPGNVGELENLMQRAAILASEKEVIAEDLIFVPPGERDLHRFHLLRRERIRALLSHPLLWKVLTGVNIAAVLAVLGFTLAPSFLPPGHPLSELANNPGMLVTWLIWFPLLPLSAILFGRLWCGICPIAGVGSLAARFVHLGRPAPRLLKRLDLWGVVFAFLLLDALEDALGVADVPAATAGLLLVILGLAVVFSVVYERRVFCRFLCPLAGVLGSYAALSPFELRGSKKVCRTQCGSFLCHKGTDRVAPCPMFTYPASITHSAGCMLCGNCLRSCDKRGVQVNLRPPLQELWRQTEPLLSLSVFAVLLVGIMLRHQLGQLPSWGSLEAGLALPGWIFDPLASIALMAMVFLPFVVASTLSAAASGESLTRNMSRYGLVFVPLAAAAHLAHVSFELLGEGLGELTAFVAKSWSWMVGALPWGSYEGALGSFVAPPVVTFVDLEILAVGIAGSLAALVLIGRGVSREHLTARILPHLLLLLVLSGALLVVHARSPIASPRAVAAVVGPGG